MRVGEANPIAFDQLAEPLALLGGEAHPPGRVAPVQEPVAVDRAERWGGSWERGQTKVWCIYA
jgi:hypothetical protein